MILLIGFLDIANDSTFNWSGLFSGRKRHGVFFWWMHLPRHSPRLHTYEFYFETLQVVLDPQFQLLVSSLQKVVP
jgi:hypothetical protein